VRVSPLAAYIDALAPQGYGNQPQPYADLISPHTEEARERLALLATLLPSAVFGLDCETLGHVVRQAVAKSNAAIVLVGLGERWVDAAMLGFGLRFQS
jgi:hypothetical protein